MTNRKKILLIGPVPPNSGGVSVHLKRLLEKSKKYPSLSLAVFDPAKRMIFYADRSSGNIFSALMFFLRADVVHIHVSHSSKVSIARLSKFLGKKIAYTQHNRYEVDLPSTKFVVRIADKVIYVFQHEKIPENAVIIPAYIPQSGNESLPVKLSEELNKFKYKIVSVSSYPKKPEGEDVYGFDLILDSLRNIPMASETALVLVDAMGAMKEYYSKKIIETERITGIKIFYIDYEINFPSLLSASTIFIRATRSDGDSLSVREALDVGTPVLASDCVARPGGCKIFRLGHVDDLRNNLIAMLQNPSRQISQQEDYSEKLFQIYSEL